MINTVAKRRMPGVIAVLCVCYFSSTAFAGKYNKTLDIGQKAPDWKGLIGTDLERHSLSDFAKSKAVVIVFTCNGCPVAQAYEERVIRFAKEMKPKGLELIAINVNNRGGDRLDKMCERARARKFNFTYLYDPSQGTARTYGAAVTPHFFLLDGDRKIAFMGSFDNNKDAERVTKNHLRDAALAVLAGKTLIMDETRQFGCGIKYETTPSFTNAALTAMIAKLSDEQTVQEKARGEKKTAKKAGKQPGKKGAKRRDKKPLKVLAVGGRAPKFQAIDDQGEIWRSTDHVGKKVVIVYFYPANMTGGCTKQACGFRDDMATLKSKNVEIIGVSGDSVRSHQLFKKAHHLNYTLLSDHNGGIARKFGVPVKKGGSLEREIGGTKYTLVRGVSASRQTFIIGLDGKLAHINRKVKAAEDSKAVLEIVGKLAK